MNTNKNYKDTVFVKLFSNKLELLNLYNAIENTNYSIDNAKLIWIQEVFQQGILKQIEMLKEFNVSREDIITRIKKDYNLTTEGIEKLL